jgi:recombination protein RecA
MPKKKDMKKKETDEAVVKEKTSETIEKEKKDDTDKAIKQEKNQGLEIAKKAIIKKYGAVISILKDHADMNIETISSGSISLDVALGRGGFGRGRIYEIFGQNSSGKTTLAINVVIEAQKRGLTCCFIDAEHAVDPTLFKNYGVNIDDLIIIQGFDGEGNLDALESLLRSGAIDVAVVDSVSSLIPRQEAESDVDKDTMAVLARLMSKALRRLTPLANQTNTLLIFINQLRMKIGTYGDPFVTSGGEAMGFYATGRISVRGPESKKRRIVDKATGEVVGHETIFEVVKNKLAAPFRKAFIKLIYGEGYDKHSEVLDIATSLGIIDRSGAWYKYNDKNFAQGEDKAVVYFKENVEFYEKIRNKVIEAVGLKEFYEPAS